MDFVYVVGGLILLFLGGEGLVRGCVAISKRLGISAILIGVVIVGFGTSTPELLVSLKASLAGQTDIALGNVVGSNIANVFLILGVAGLIHPIACGDRAILRDSAAVVVVSLLLWGAAFYGVVDRAIGGAMIALLVAYLVYAYFAERQAKAKAEHNGETVYEHEVEEFDDKLGLTPSLLISVVSIVMLVFGADFLVEGASNIARALGVSDAVIGLSLVAIGTSLPELATAISASIKKHSDVVIGNVLGSNLFNILAILGITAIVTPIPVGSQMANVDIPIALGVAVVTLLVVALYKQVARPMGALFLAAYVAYIAWLYTSGGAAPI